MTEIKLTKRYPQSRTEDIVDAYMRGWNDALDAVQNGKFIINDDRKTEPNSKVSETPTSSENPNNCEDEPQNDVSCFTCIHDNTGHIECQSCDDNYSSYEAKTEPQTDCSWK